MTTSHDPDQWLDLQALENETAQLLQTVRGTKRKHAGGKENNQSETINNGTTKTTAKRNSSAKKKAVSNGDTMNRKTALMEVTQSLDGGLMNRTRNLYSGGGGSGTSKVSSNRITVEVLDDAGEDLTPRNMADIKREQLQKSLNATFTAKFQEAAEKESSIRSVQFHTEKTRILKRDDTFIPAPSANVHDVNREKSRLEQLEESARQRNRQSQSEAETRQEFLQQDWSAVKIQRLFRGIIGRQRCQLVKRLKDLDDTGTDWIEVRDRESGDTWFYNKKTGVSQWEKPAEMAGKLSRNAQLKHLAVPTAFGTAAGTNTLLYTVMYLFVHSLAQLLLHSRLQPHIHPSQHSLLARLLVHTLPCTLSYSFSPLHPPLPHNLSHTHFYSILLYSFTYLVLFTHQHQTGGMGMGVAVHERARAASASVTRGVNTAPTTLPSLAVQSLPPHTPTSVPFRITHHPLSSILIKYRLDSSNEPNSLSTYPNDILYISQTTANIPSQNPSISTLTTSSSHNLLP